ncbi:DUF1573 domain-containing protein [Chitinophagaceae bacterium MMS25-I14]
MKKVMIMLALSGIAFGVKAQNPVPDSLKDGPMFKFKEETFDFKNIPQGPVAEHVFKFKNIGKKPLIVQTATASCGCTRPEVSSAPVKPGKSGEITVRYNTKGRPGAFTKDVFIISNAANGQPQYTIHIKGAVSATPLKTDTKSTPK